MKQPLWRRLLSHVMEQHLESAPSEHNPHLYVSLLRGRYQLSTKNAVYSFADLYDNYALTFAHLDWSRIPGNEVLLLGVGLGSVPYMLEKKFGKSMRYTGVEIDQHVLHLANKYVFDELSSPMSIHCADAYSFIFTNPNKYDIICMDVFLDDVTPESMRSTEFLQQLKDSLTASGVLLYNCLARTRDDVKQTRDFMESAFFKVFPQGGYLDVRGNWMLLSDVKYTTKV